MERTNDALTEVFGEPISVYTRAQAIEDGVLVDVTEWASAEHGFHGGFTVPVAVTAGVWSMIESIPASQSHQDVRGRAHDVLFMASLAARQLGRQGKRDGFFGVLMHVKGTRKRKHTLRIVSGPGDAGEHVITIMLPEED